MTRRSFTRPTIGTSWGLLAACLLLQGCGLSDMVRVEGTVTLDGEPLANANVVFRAPGQPVATGRTDGSGRYRVVTGGASGMKPGEYSVTVAAYERPKGPNGPPSPKLAVPAKYVKPDSSGLTAVIQGGSNNAVNFELKTS